MTASGKTIAVNNDVLPKRTLVFVCLLVLLPLSFIAALSFGTVHIDFSAVLNSLVISPLNSSPILDDSSGQSSLSARADLIIQQIRLPRALLAAFVGALLGISGATMQGLFRNPLADPSLIGVTAGASAGGALAIVFASSFTALTGFTAITVVSLGAFTFGALAVILVYALATNRNGTSVATMLLVGIAITAIASSVTSLLEFFSDDEMLRRITLWRMGGLDGANYDRVLVVALFSIVILAVLPRFSTALNALLLGESEARHLGLSVQKIKIRLILLVAAGVGITVALAGTITFIGLVVPHIIRLLIGPNHRYLLPASAIGGAILLLISDTLARTLFAPVELPVGLVTALLGAPFFISLLRQRHNFGMR